ncbi:PorT family protein [Spirosoma sp. BT702]|uniref:PorT family protein n=1 Tax=Spirosoma profusum TaxID=2771354 RepID=A0A927AQN6_9BACT|nr:porin family protein [Spirosoma profusum]MBD2700903.1 PorT family protein [Spirosoma profusum]
MFRANSLRSIALSLFLISTCLSGSLAQQRFSAGPRVGLNLSNYWGKSDNMKFTPGVSAGVFLMYSSLNHFGLSADFLYSQRGTDYNDGRIKFKQRVNYLEIPVLARYFLTLEGNFRPNVFIGPSLAIKLNAKRLDGEYLSGTGPAINSDNGSDFNDLDLGAAGGFQLNWGTGNRQHFLIDARYTLGLSNVQSNLPNIWGNRSPLQNSTFTLALGYSFGVGREHPSRYRR